MKLKAAIAIMLCTAYLPSPAGAGNFFENLINHTKEQVSELVNHTSEQTGELVDHTNEQAYEQVDLANNRAKKRVTDQIDQAKQSIGTTTSFSNSQLSGSMDIIGLRLGMTPQNVKAILQAHNATMRIEEKYEPLFRMPNSRYLRHISAKANTGEHIFIEFSPPPHAALAVKLSRTTQYAAGARPTLAKTLQALEQKYGTPTLNNNNTVMHQLSWLHDKTGNKIASASANLVRHCTKAFMLPVDQLVISPQLGNGAIAECGESLNIHLATEVNAITGGRGVNGNSLIAGLTATLGNAAELIHITQKTTAYIGNAIQTQANNVAAPKL
ncbi:MAG: hypothetical protein L3J88_01095 [Gammaproteobacteria bacterium]|nr:hypothetical protein [Gammaproteobacteria bacterium]MCF6361964.1 hypothetical protein [Gammaproteobacteria bacterium]